MRTRERMDVMRGCNRGVLIQGVVGLRCIYGSTFVS